MTTIIFNKPYGVLCQFRADGDRPTLADYIDLPGVYAAGRLDTDSEGLLVLTSDGSLQHRIADPKHKLTKTYWAQVEGVPDDAALERLRTGVPLREFVTAPADTRRLHVPASLWQRSPPIRVRQHIPDTWLEIGLREGKNRQVRRMTAAVGFPTLRLVRVAIGGIHLFAGESLRLLPGQWQSIEPRELFVRPRYTAAP